MRDVEFAYNGRPVLSGVTVDVTAGETIAIMGANGSGKTTLLRLLAGLCEPDAGSVEVAGVVGFAPEDPRAALFAGTVAEEVQYFPQNRGLDAPQEADRAMRKLAVYELRKRNPLSLSVGEQRRVSIAAVLAGDPGVLALDEPTAGLDAGGERHLGRLLSDLETTVVLSTHAADFAYRFADRVLVLADGEIRRRGDPRDVLSDLTLLDRSGIRPPGIVTWANQHGVDHLPADFDDAASLVRGQR